MKNFTRIFSIVIASMLSVSAFAQYDLEASELNTMSTTSMEVPPNIPLILTLVFENTGTADIPDQSTALLVFLNGNDTLQTINGTFNGAMTVGASYSFNSDPVTLPAAPPNVSLCGFVFLDVLGETDTTNNLVCSQFTVSSSAIVDLKAVGLNVNAPNDLDGFDVDNGDEEPDPITDVNSVWKNVGNVTFPAGFVIPYVYEFDGNQTLIYQGTLQAPLAPDDSSTRPSVDPSFNVPAEEGDYEICVYNVYGDADASNDTICWSWTMIDTYVPPPPIGVEEDIFAADANIFNINKTIWVKNVKSPLTINVTDVNGRMVDSRRMTEDGSISLETEAAGVYIVRSLNEANGKSSMRKISIQ